MTNSEAMTSFTQEDVERVADGLTKLEADLLTGRAEGWGSWMFPAANHMVWLGLGTKRDGSISFDTPFGLAVRNHILEQAHD